MGPSGKWIEGIDADGIVADAARRSLEARLTAVAHWLPLGAHDAAEDVEHVHRLRVSTRRAVAALRLYRDWLPTKSARWVKKRLKKIRRAAGEARDLDVLAERLIGKYGECAAPVLPLIVEQRAAIQPAILKVAERCRRKDRFVRKTSKLVGGIASPNAEAASVCFREWATEQLAKSASQFFAAAPDETADAAALHRFRIEAKKLRYTIELVASAFGPELREEHYPVVEELQEWLGAIQDHVAASEQLRQWSQSVADDSQRELLQELATKEAAGSESAITEFRAWWTAERMAALRRGLAFCHDPRGNAAAATPTPEVARQM